MINGASFEDLTRLVADSVLGFGRCGVLVDVQDDEIPYTAFYNPLSIIAWPDTKLDKPGAEIILSEMVEIIDPDEPNKTKTIEQLRKLFIDDFGFYCVSVYRKQNDEDDFSLYEGPNYPVYKGKKLSKIPFTFFGSSSNVPEPSRPPLLDLLNLLKGHWRLTVAYQYGLHFAGLPTPCFAGFSFEEGQKIALGPGAAYHSDDPSAKSWFLQTGGEGLASMEKGLDRLERQMAVVGARMLEEQRPGVEAAETVKLRSSGDTATLADIAGNIENGLSDVLKNFGFWLGISDDLCFVTVNKDFVSARLSPQDIMALLQSVQSGMISEETFLYNLEQGEVLPPERSIEEEQEKIAEDRLITQRNNKNMGGDFDS